MKPPALGPVVYHVARHGFPTYVRQRALALATNAHLAYVQVSNSPLVQIIAFDLAVVLLSFSCIYIVLHAAYAILEQTVLGESRKTREEKMRELDGIFKAYKYSVPEDEMDKFQKDFANFTRRRGYRISGSLLPSGPSAEDDLAIAPLASVNGDIPLAAKGFRVVEVPERPITPPPLPIFAAVISPGASSFVSLSHTSPAGNLTKAPLRIQPLARKAYTPAHTLEAIAAQEGVSEPLTSRLALPVTSFAEQPLAATVNGTYELGTGLAPGETMLGTNVPAPVPPLRQPSSSAGPADFASNAPLLRDAPLFVEGDALFGDVAPLVQADTPVDEIAADGLAAPVSADGTDIHLPADGVDIALTGDQLAVREQQILIPPNASLTRMSPTADPTRDIGVAQALSLPPMADSTLSLPVNITASRVADSTSSREANSSVPRTATSTVSRQANSPASRQRAGSTAILPAERLAGASGTASSRSAPRKAVEDGTSVAAEQGVSTSASLSPTMDTQNTQGAHAADTQDERTDDGEARAEATSPSPEDVAEPVHAVAASSSSANEAGDGAEDAKADSPEAAIDDSQDATTHKRAERSGDSPEDPIVVSPDSDNSLSLSEGDITLSADDDAHSDGVAKEDPTSEDHSILPADGRSVLPANGPRSAFDDSDEEDEDEEEEDDVEEDDVEEDDEEEDDEEEEEDIVDASTLHNGTLSPIAEGVDEEEEDGTAHRDQVKAVSDDHEAGIVSHIEEAGPVHHEHVEPGVSYAAAVRGDGPVWWT